MSTETLAPPTEPTKKPTRDVLYALDHQSEQIWRDEQPEILSLLLDQIQLLRELSELSCAPWEGTRADWDRMHDLMAALHDKGDAYQHCLTALHERVDRLHAALVQAFCDPGGEVGS